MWQFWLMACATWIALFFRSFIDTLWLVLVRNSYSTRACWIWDDHSQLLWARVKDKLPKNFGKKKMVSLLLMVIAFSNGITILWIGGNSIAWPLNFKKSGKCRPSRALLRRSVTRDLFFGCTLQWDSRWGRIALGHIIKKGFEGHAPLRNLSSFLNVRDQC